LLLFYIFKLQLIGKNDKSSQIISIKPQQIQIASLDILVVAVEAKLRQDVVGIQVIDFLILFHFFITEVKVLVAGLEFGNQ